ncbi:MAG: imidazolonepropionase [Flavobacteriales bacterium]
MKILIKNIDRILQYREDPPQTVEGEKMKELPSLENAYIAIDEGVVKDVDSMENWPGIEDWRGLEVIDARGRMVMPAWIDSHSHIVYAGSREKEFVDRIKGLSYEEIAARGGGILNSAELLRETSEGELFEAAMKRVDEVKSMGTGALEIKSGYGLSLESELKMLRVADRIRRESNMTVRRTFLGAHAIPKEYKDERTSYVDLVVNEMIPQVAEEGLADHVDVFCERGFFTKDESDRVLKAGIEHGMKAKVHANELDYSGGVQVGVENDAVSVDHLECTGDEEIESLKGSGTMPTLLPATAFFLKLDYPPARQMIDAGLPVALSTDYNPGSCPCGNMNLVNSLACIYMDMLPEEAINASTINSAYAMGLSETHGTVTPGRPANLMITKPIPSYAYIPYAFGSDPIDTLILDGKLNIREKGEALHEA